MATASSLKKKSGIERVLVLINRVGETMMALVQLSMNTANKVQGLEEGLALTYERINAIAEQLGVPMPPDTSETSGPASVIDSVTTQDIMRVLDLGGDSVTADEVSPVPAGGDSDTLADLREQATTTDVVASE